MDKNTIPQLKGRSSRDSHLNDINVNYLEHLRRQLSMSGSFFKLSIKSIVHGCLPCVCLESISDDIEEVELIIEKEGIKDYEAVDEVASECPDVVLGCSTIVGESQSQVHRRHTSKDIEEQSYDVPEGYSPYKPISQDDIPTDKSSVGSHLLDSKPSSSIFEDYKGLQLVPDTERNGLIDPLSNSMPILSSTLPEDVVPPILGSDKVGLDDTHMHIPSKPQSGWSNWVYSVHRSYPGYTSNNTSNRTSYISTADPYPFATYLEGLGTNTFKELSSVKVMNDSILDVSIPKDIAPLSPIGIALKTDTKESASRPSPISTLDSSDDEWVS